MRSNLVVKLAQTAKTACPRNVKVIGKMACFVAKATAKLPEEVNFVHPVAARMERIGRRPQVHSGTNANHAAKFCGRRTAPFACQFQNQVPAHRKSSESDPAELAIADQRMSDLRHIARAPRVIEGRSECVGPAAGSLVHANHIHARGKPFCGYSHSVRRVARPFQSMDDDDGERLGAIRLPMAVAKHLNASFHLNEALFRRRQMQLTLQKKSCQSLLVASAQPATSAEFILDLR